MAEDADRRDMKGEAAPLHSFGEEFKNLGGERVNARTELERLLAEWHERGNPAEAPAFIAAHPEHADALRKHLGVLDLVEHAFRSRPALPESLGPFRIGAEIGSGGMGCVYRAVVAEPVRGLATGRTVALKVVHPHLFRTPGFFKRFLREAELGQRIDHPNVVRTLDADAAMVDDRPQHYLVMEYVEGQTLRDLVEDVDRVPEELARHVGCEVAKALSAIHAAGAVHRDLKPENVLITKDHEVKVMDLGVARLVDEQVRLSQTGAFVGSLHYAAPEQFGGGADVDFRADLHGLGLLLYEIATGANPYADEDAHVVMKRILSEVPRKAGEINPQLSPFFEELLAQLLEKDPAARFDSASDVLDILEASEKSDWWRTRAKEMRAISKRPLRRIRVPRETAVYGRDAELAQLRALYDAAHAGEGRVVLIEGEAGIGKTRLVDEFAARLQQEGKDVNFLFASYPPGGAATASGAFSAAYRDHLGEESLDDTLAELLTQTPVLVPAFGAILRGDATPEGCEPLTKDSLQTCFIHITRNLAAERTTIVLIDDLHFAPEEGRALFTSVALAAPGHRILLIGTMRPGVPEDWIAGTTRLEHTSQLTVPRLGPKDLIHLLGDSFMSERLAEELAGKVGIKSDGNPFFAFEIIRGLREGQFITQRENGSWHTTRLIEDIQVPSSVLDLVNARVADLDDDDRNLLDVATCWGYEFDPKLVAAALGMPRLPVLQRLAKIEKRDRLVRARGRAFVFDHHQVQEALYSALPEMLREEYHAALAGALEASTCATESDPAALYGAVSVNLCEHFLMGAQGGRALRYLAAAQTHLQRNHVHDRSIALAERALAVPGLLADEARASVLLQLCRANGSLDKLGRVAEREDAARELELLANASGDISLQQASAMALGTSQFDGGRGDAAESTLLRALGLAREQGDVTAEVLAMKVLGDVYRRHDRRAEAQRMLEQAVALVEQLDGQPGRVVDPRPNLGAVLAERGQLDAARRCFEGHLATARANGDLGEQAFASGQLGVLNWAQEHLAEARALVEHQLAFARSTGARTGEMLALGNLTGILHELGLAAESEAASERYMHLAVETGSVIDQVLANVNHGPMCLTRGDAAQARVHIEKALEQAREHRFGSLEASALYYLAEVADEEDEPDDAVDLSQRALAIRREIGHELDLVCSLVQLGDLLYRSGATARAKVVLDEALSLSRTQQRRDTTTLILALLAQMPGESVDDAREGLEAGCSPATAKHVRLLLWRSTHRRSDLAEARRLLDEALQQVSVEHRGPTLGNVRVNREIMAAWREELGEDELPATTESETHAG